MTQPSIDVAPPPSWTPATGDRQLGRSWLSASTLAGAPGPSTRRCEAPTGPRRAPYSMIFRRPDLMRPGLMQGSEFHPPFSGRETFRSDRTKPRHGCKLLIHMVFLRFSRAKTKIVSRPQGPVLAARSTEWQENASCLRKNRQSRSMYVCAHLRDKAHVCWINTISCHLGSEKQKDCKKTLAGRFDLCKYMILNGFFPYGNRHICDGVADSAKRVRLDRQTHPSDCFC